MLLDSNMIIYASQSEFSALREFIAENSPFISAISYVEVLGYHRLTENERDHFQAFFQAAPILPLSNNVLDQAVK